MTFGDGGADTDTTVFTMQRLAHLRLTDCYWFDTAYCLGLIDDEEYAAGCDNGYTAIND